MNLTEMEVVELERRDEYDRQNNAEFQELCWKYATWCRHWAQAKDASTEYLSGGCLSVQRLVLDLNLGSKTFVFWENLLECAEIAESLMMEGTEVDA